MTTGTKKSLAKYVLQPDCMACVPKDMIRCSWWCECEPCRLSRIEHADCVATYLASKFLKCFAGRHSILDGDTPTYEVQQSTEGPIRMKKGSARRAGRWGTSDQASTSPTRRLYRTWLSLLTEAICSAGLLD